MEKPIDFTVVLAVLAVLCFIAAALILYYSTPRVLLAPGSNDGPRALSDSILILILTLIPFLVLIPGAWALAVWASKQRDSQSKLVDKLTARKKETP
jgi:hypothetical protein